MSPENSSILRISHPAEENAMDIPRLTKENRKPLQKQATKSTHGSERKAAYAVKRKGIKPVRSRLTIDTEPRGTLRIKETTGVPAYRKRTVPPSKPKIQQTASDEYREAGFKDTISTRSNRSNAKPPSKKEIISEDFANAGGITRHGHKIPQSKCSNTILQNLQKFKLF